MMIVDDEVRGLARQIADRFQPDKIILFGSHAAGRADAGSDVDLLVMMDYVGRPVDKQVEIRQHLQWGRPLDVLVRSSAEIEHRLALGDWFLRDVIDQGVLLYERAHQ